MVAPGTKELDQGPKRFFNESKLSFFEPRAGVLFKKVTFSTDSLCEETMTETRANVFSFVEQGTLLQYFR